MHHWLTLVSGFVEGLCFTGIAYGWASLVFVLKADGYFADHCVNTTGEDHVVSTDCSGQDDQLSMVMSVASFFTNILRFPFGFIFDRYGTTVVRLLAIANKSALLFPALSCLISSGMMLYITNAQVGNLFDTRRSTVISIYTGAFDSSAAVFLIIKFLHERGVSFHTSFFMLSSCSIIHLFRTFFLMPRGHIPYPLPEGYTYGVGVSCLRQRRGRGEEERKRGEMKKEEVMEKYETDERAVVESSLLQLQDKLQHEPSHEEAVTFRSCVLSWFFLWHLLWVAIIQFCHFLFLATVNPMLNRLSSGDQSQVSQYTDAFAYTQLSAVLCSPWNGLILDRHKRRPLAPGETKQEADLRSFSLSLFLTSLQCFLFCVCFCCPLLRLQYLTFILQVINSSFIYGGHQAFVNTAFPACHFGKLSGLMMSISAVMLLLQLPVLQVIQQQLHGDPLYVNAGVTVLSLLTFIHPLHVFLHCRKQANKRRAKQEVDDQEIKL
ncbi:equilibrative nucleobase transporter 1-like [Polymixia lowei]